VTNLPQPRSLELRVSACPLLPQVTGRVGGSLQKSVAKGFERGETESPEAIDQHTLLHLVGDMVGVLDALGAERAVIAGHDWGAPVAWHAALLRPDRFRRVVGLSVPFIPGGQVSFSANE
jgi:pimeloyl-ACP methyl ester carboxylesterase